MSAESWPTEAEEEVIATAGCLSHVEAGWIADALAVHVARREREAAGRALREAAEFADGSVAIGLEQTRPDRVATWLHVRADRIERGLT